MRGVRRAHRLGHPSEPVLLLAVTGALALGLIERWRFARLPRAPLGAGFSERAGSGADPSVALAASGDVAVLLALLMLGGLLVPRALPLGVARPGVALLTGVALQATLGVLLLGWPWSALALVVGAAAGGWVLRSRGVATGWRRSDAVPLAASALILAATAAATRANGWVIFTADSSDYWRGAAQLAAGTLGPADLDMKRMLALQSLHAPGFGLGTDGVLTLGPALLVTAVALIALLPWLVAPRPSWMVRATASAAALLVGGSLWFWFVALYLNSHLLVATMLLLVAVLTYLAERSGGVRAVAVPIALATSTVVLARLEGVVVVALLLIGTLTHAASWRDWRPVWWWLGGVVIAWNGLLLVGAGGGAALPLVPVLGVAAGAGLLIAPVILGRAPAVLRVRVPVVVGTLLWSVTAVLLLTGVGERIVFADMVRRNIGEGAGSWYLLGPTVALMGVFGLALTTDRPALAPTRWLLIGFIPVTLLAKLADGSDRLGVDAGDSLRTILLSGGGRLSAGDSVNRMWTHAALAAVVLLVIAVIDRPRDGRSPRGVPPAPVPTLAAVLMLVLVASWWRPEYLGPVGPLTEVVLASSVTDRAGPELTDGTVLDQRVDVPAGLTLPADLREVRVCVEVAFTDAGRGADGRFRMTLTAGDVTVTEMLRGEATEDGSVKDVCVAPTVPLPDTIHVELAGTTGAAVGSIVTLTDASGGFVRHAAVLIDAPSLDPRGPAVRAVSWTIRSLIQGGPIVLGLALLVVTALRRRQESDAAAELSSPGG
jgi:hypothetical protein